MLRPAEPPPAAPAAVADVDTRMLEQVQEVLPHVPRLVIENDLRRTGNSLITIENLLQLEEPVPGVEELLESAQNAPTTTAPLASTAHSSSAVQSTSAASSYSQEEEATIRRRHVLAAVERRLEFPRLD